MSDCAALLIALTVSIVLGFPLWSIVVFAVALALTVAAELGSDA